MQSVFKVYLHKQMKMNLLMEFLKKLLRHYREMVNRDNKLRNNIAIT